MLTSGMVPALYADDEKEAIVGQVSTNTQSHITIITCSLMATLHIHVSHTLTLVSLLSYNSIPYNYYGSIGKRWGC